MPGRVRYWLRAVFQRARIEREMQEEMELHLTRSTERLVSRGMKPHEARRAARIEFGNLDSLQEEARDARGARWIESTIADLRFGLRHFGRTPVTTLTMIVLLALGIGFASALFTLIYSMSYLPPPGIARQESLVRIRGIDANRGPGGTLGRDFAYPEYREYAARTNLFSAAAAWTSSDVVLDVDGLHSGAATFVTANYFRVLGVRPILGAGLPVGHTDDGAPQLVGVISYAVWDRLFARAPDVVGRTLKVNDVDVAIVGVAPQRFAGARTGGSQMRVWLPLNARPVVQRSSVAALSSYDSVLFSLGARLRPGVTTIQTAPTVQAIAAQSARLTTRWQARSAISTDVVPLQGDNYYPSSGEQASFVGRAAGILMALLILLIPCTNVSGLLAGVAVKRSREIAVRMSLGAGRRRIVRQLITESVLLAFAAGALGLFAIWALITTIGKRIPDIQLALHWPAIVFTFAIAGATGMLFGLSPALHATRVSVADVLKNAANAVASTRSRLQSGLVVAQIALTQPLLLGLGALLLSLFSEVRGLPDLTFGDRILQVTFNTNVPNADAGAGDAARERRRADLLAQLQQRYAALPGVEAVVAQQDRSSYVPVNVHPADQVQSGVAPGRVVLRTSAAPAGFFALMGVPFLRGRAFEPGDDSRAVIIRGDLARRLWGAADPIGRRLVSEGGSTAFVIVGVVDETKAGLSADGTEDVYVPNLQRIGGMLVRTRGPAEPVAQLLRTIANEEAPIVPVTRVRTLASIIDEERATLRKATAAAVSSGVIALLLSAIGLYVIVSFAVNQRTREIGIRTALGAESRQVVRMFFLNGLRLSLIGLLIGLSLSVIVIRIATLAEGKETDVRIFLIGSLVALTVLSVASVATWIPARRAALVDPLSMLRVE